MNEQEMQFADPDWQPRGSAPLPQEDTVIGAPSVQPVKSSFPYGATSQDAGALSYGQGYRGMPQQQYSSYTAPVAQQVPVQQVARARRRSGWWIWVIIVIVIISMISGMSHSSNRGFPGYQGYQGAGPRPGPGYTYDLRGTSQISLNDASGFITVQTGNIGTQKITVQTDDNSLPNVSYTENSMTIDSGDSGSVTVIVPPDAGLSLNISATSVEVDRFKGQIVAQSTTGSITLQEDVLSGQSNITSQSGDITLGQDALSGQVTVQTGGNGAISFDGTLDPRGAYQFTTDSGDITLNLPADTAMQVSLTPGTGTYHNDFTNPTGSAPRAAVTVKTTSGNIGIHQN
jgi:hypothetical protein